MASRQAVSQRFEPLRVGGGEAALAGAAAARKGVLKRRRLLGGGAIVLGTSLLGWQGGAIRRCVIRHWRLPPTTPPARENGATCC